MYGHMDVKYAIKLYMHSTYLRIKALLPCSLVGGDTFTLRGCWFCGCDFQ